MLNESYDSLIVDFDLDRLIPGIPAHVEEATPREMFEPNTITITTVPDQ